MLFLQPSPKPFTSPAMTSTFLSRSKPITSPRRKSSSSRINREILHFPAPRHPASFLPGLHRQQKKPNFARPPTSSSTTKPAVISQAASRSTSTPAPTASPSPTPFNQHNKPKLSPPGRHNQDTIHCPNHPPSTAESTLKTPPFPSPLIQAEISPKKLPAIRTYLQTLQISFTSFDIQAHIRQGFSWTAKNLYTPQIDSSYL